MNEPEALQRGYDSALAAAHVERDQFKKERDAFKEENARLKTACDLFEKNSADAIDLEKERDAAKRAHHSLVVQFNEMVVNRDYWKKRVEEMSAQLKPVTRDEFNALRARMVIMENWVNQFIENVRKANGK